MVVNQIQTYIDFVRYSIGVCESLPDGVKEIDWLDFFNYCNRQGILGLVFDGVQRADVKMPREVLFEWMSYSEIIKVRNRLLNDCSVKLVDCFSKQGYRSCILKGQANGLMYSHPELRSPGDVDIWFEGEREEIIKFILTIYPKAHYSIHHIKFAINDDISVEVHYTPVTIENWFLNKKLQKFIVEEAPKQFSHHVNMGDSKICCLTDVFNVLYQILHMYHHFLGSRNSLKQFIDYYMLLEKCKFDDGQIEMIIEKLREFNVLKYATGIMWIMHNVLGLDKTKLILEPNVKQGWLIFRESSYYGTFSANKPRMLLEMAYLNIKLFPYYPLEILLGPLFFIWHQLWKLKTILHIRKSPIRTVTSVNSTF